MPQLDHVVSFAEWWPVAGIPGFAQIRWHPLDASFGIALWIRLTPTAVGLRLRLGVASIRLANILVMQVRNRLWHRASHPDSFDRLLIGEKISRREGITAEHASSMRTRMATCRRALLHDGYLRYYCAHICIWRRLLLISFTFLLRFWGMHF